MTSTTAPPTTAATAATESPVAPDVAARLERYVERAQAAASAFRKLDQEDPERPLSARGPVAKQGPLMEMGSGR